MKKKSQGSCLAFLNGTKYSSNASTLFSAKEFFFAASAGGDYIILSHYLKPRRFFRFPACKSLFKTRMRKSLQKW